MMNERMDEDLVMFKLLITDEWKLFCAVVT